MLKEWSEKLWLKKSHSNFWGSIKTLLTFSVEPNANKTSSDGLCRSHGKRYNLGRINFGCIFARSRRSTPANLALSRGRSGQSTQKEALSSHCIYTMAFKRPFRTLSLCLLFYHCFLHFFYCIEPTLYHFSSNTHIKHKVAKNEINIKFWSNVLVFISKVFPGTDH